MYIANTELVFEHPLQCNQQARVLEEETPPQRHAGVRFCTWVEASKLGSPKPGPVQVTLMNNHAV